MSRLLLAAALAGLLACAAAAPVGYACSGKQNNYFGIEDNEYQDTASKNFVDKAFSKLQPWLATQLISDGTLAPGCTFEGTILDVAPDSGACYKTISYNAQGKPETGAYGFATFEMDFLCPEGLNGPQTVNVLNHLECQAVVYTSRDGSWWKSPDYTCQ